MPLQGMAVLGIKDRGLFGGKAKEFGVEILEPVQRRGEGHIIGLTQTGAAFACGQKLFLGQAADRFRAGAQIGPKASQIASARHMRRHADNRNVGRRQSGISMGPVVHSLQSLQAINRPVLRETLPPFPAPHIRRGLLISPFSAAAAHPAPSPVQGAPPAARREAILHAP